MTKVTLSKPPNGGPVTSINAQPPLCPKIDPPLIHPYRLEVTRHGDTKVMYWHIVTDTTVVTIHVPRFMLTAVLNTLCMTDTRGGHPAAAFPSPPTGRDAHSPRNPILENVLAKAVGTVIELHTGTNTVRGSLIGVHVPTSRKRFNEVPTVLLEHEGRVKLVALTDQSEVSVAFDRPVAAMQPFLPLHAQTEIVPLHIVAAGLGEGFLRVSYLLQNNVQSAFDISYDVSVHNPVPEADITSEDMEASLRAHVQFSNPLPFDLNDVELQICTRCERDKVQHPFHDYPNGPSDIYSFERQQENVKFASDKDSSASDTASSDTDSSSDTEEEDNDVIVDDPVIVELHGTISVAKKHSARLFLYESTCNVRLIHSTDGLKDGASVFVKLFNTSQMPWQAGDVCLSGFLSDDLRFPIPFIGAGEQRQCCKIRDSRVVISKVVPPTEAEPRSCKLIGRGIYSLWICERTVRYDLQNKEDVPISLVIVLPTFNGTLDHDSVRVTKYDRAVDVGKLECGIPLRAMDWGKSHKQRFLVRLHPNEKRILTLRAVETVKTIQDIKSSLNRTFVSDLLRCGCISKEISCQFVAMIELEQNLYSMEELLKGHLYKDGVVSNQLTVVFEQELDMEDGEDGSPADADKAWDKYMATMERVRKFRTTLREEMTRIRDCIAKYEDEWETFVHVTTRAVSAWTRSDEYRVAQASSTKRIAPLDYPF